MGCERRWCTNRGPWLRRSLGREYGTGFPVFRTIDALQGQSGTPPQDPPGALPGDQLAGVRQSAPAARQPDGVGHAGGLGSVASAQDRPAGPVAALRGHRDRDWAPAALGLWLALAADRRAAALARRDAWPG